MSDGVLAATLERLAAAIEHHAEALDALAEATALRACGDEDDDAPLFPGQEM